MDMLKIIKPLLIVQSISILLPDAVNAFEVTLNQIRQPRKKCGSNDKATLENEKYFPTLNKEILRLIDY